VEGGEVPVQLARISWQDVERYLTSRDVVIIPAGSTEQHGPSGLCGTDALVAEAMARAAGEKTGTIVAPLLAYGMATHHMGFPGTVTLRPTTLISLVHDVVASLHRHGFRGFYFVNGHGGNIATLNAAFSEMHHALDGCRFRLMNWWHIPEVKKLEEEIFGDRNGKHATPSEISITMHLLPGAVKAIDGPLEIGAQKHPWPLAAEEFRAAYPDGRMGSDPALADPGHGKRLFERCVRIVAEDVRAFVES
jgi:creatinine amidohydrolase